MDPSYCGECYGATAPATAIKAGCCNTCAEVREAYAGSSWAFGRGEGVEQCEREHYSEHLDAQRREGCRIEGGIRVNKVVGNFHFAPGKSFSNGQMHVHDLENYFESSEAHSFTHHIHHLRFGPQLNDDLVRKLTASAPLGSGMAWTKEHMSPLDGTEQHTEVKPYNYMYFIKVVSTAYLPLGWESSGRSMFGGLDEGHDLVELGEYGHGASGSIETHQYSVTSHKRSLEGGNDAADGHKERLHARGGIPGVFMSVSSACGPRPGLPTRMLTSWQYDISPMKVINREKRGRSFSAFLVGVCAVVGGTLTVASTIDRLLYGASERIKKLHNS